MYVIGREGDNFKNEMSGLIINSEMLLIMQKKKKGFRLKMLTRATKTTIEDYIIAR